MGIDAYDAQGRFAGRVEDDGTIYDTHGTPLGRVDSNGGIYNKYGSPSGSVDRNGEVSYTHDPLGRVAEDGTIYKAKNPYDSHADEKPPKVLGTVKGSSDVRLRGAAALLLSDSGVFHVDRPTPRMPEY